MDIETLGGIPTIETERLRLRLFRRFIGRIGIINPLGWPGPEVGWTLGKAWWGHGYATEGARAAIAWGFEQHRFEELISLIDPANSSSIRVAERLGEHRLREMELLGHEVLAYGIRRARWEGPS